MHRILPGACFVYAPAMHAVIAVLVSLCALATAAGSNETFAVVGAGPHGLTAALELKQRGHNVTVFERGKVQLPIIDSIQIGSIVYEYFSQTLLPSATSDGSGSPAVLSQFAQQYRQPLNPLPSAETTLSFDSVAGVNPVPSSWLPFLVDTLDQVELLEELAAGYAILRELDSYPPTPDGVLESGIASANQTFATWAQGFAMPAFTDFLELVFNTALSGPVSETIAANTLNQARVYLPGPLRQAFLLQGELQCFGVRA